jgi:hypothetical protein
MTKYGAGPMGGGGGDGNILQGQPDYKPLVHSSRRSDREQQRLVCWHGIRSLYTTHDRSLP